MLLKKKCDYFLSNLYEDFSKNILFRTDLMFIITLYKVNIFSRNKKIMRINFGFCKTGRRNICDATLQIEKIFNVVINCVIFFRAKLY